MTSFFFEPAPSLFAVMLKALQTKLVAAALGSDALFDRLVGCRIHHLQIFVAMRNA